ncbi:MAG: hypothetical protein AB7S81_05940 [Bdellovibrionales bacterium]
MRDILVTQEELEECNLKNGMPAFAGMTELWAGLSFNPDRHPSEG